MTPAAITRVARGAIKRRATSTTDHRRRVAKPSAPRTPRRVSGPAGGRAATVAEPATAPKRTPERTPSAPARAPRRVSSPRARRLHPAAPLAARSLARLRALPDHTLLDRVVRGRAWIPLLGVLLVGIVAMQVEVLKLGASMGRSIQRGAALKSRNELLRASVAALTDPQRIESLAAQQGMVMPAPIGVGLLSVRSGTNPQRAIANLHAPNPGAFVTQATTNGAVAVYPTTTTPTTATSTVPGMTPAATSTPASAVAPAATPASTSIPTSTVAPAASTSTPTSTVAPTATPASTSSPTAGPTSPAPVAVSPTQTGATAGSASIGTVGNGG